MDRWMELPFSSFLLLQDWDTVLIMLPPQHLAQCLTAQQFSDGRMPEKRWLTALVTVVTLSPGKSHGHLESGDLNYFSGFVALQGSHSSGPFSWVSWERIERATLYTVKGKATLVRTFLFLNLFLLLLSDAQLLTELPWSGSREVAGPGQLHCQRPAVQNSPLRHRLFRGQTKVNLNKTSFWWRILQETEEGP